jgi:hypothetical protein
LLPRWQDGPQSKATFEQAQWRIMADSSEIRRTMKLVIDGVEDMPAGDEAVQRNLRRSFSGLRDILTRLPEDRLMEAEMVAEQSKVFLETVSQSRMNQTMLRSASASAGLRQAPERLDVVAPSVLTLCRQITDQVE